MMAPPRKGKTGMIVIISVIVLVVIVGGVVAALAFTGGKKTTNNNNPAATSAPAATPTPAIPSNFKKFSNSRYSIGYPSDWTSDTSSSGTNDEDFTGPTAQIFQVVITPNASPGEETLFNSGYCSVLGSSGGTKPSPTSISLGGQQWQQLDCGDNGTLHAIVESVIYKGDLYTLDYLSSSATFDSDRTQFFQPMERSFQFLT